ncbi:sigma-70 family RNA polymerase sigma factor [Rubrivirga sp.]|uniref:sigma-70 family RNA polymerase sigma factor n=1 Tax=Rubrivirga sp. TaxID=1885344 RepID=UPI003C71CF3C
MSRADVTELLEASRDGQSEASAKLLEAVYDELRQIARSFHARHDIGDTLTATSLVHEAYFKLVDGDRLPFDGRAHFFGAAARAMRQVVVDSARSKNRAKRGGGQAALRLDEALPVAAPGRSEDVLALDEALVELEKVDPRAARVVECRYFAGLTVEETAGALEVSPMTVKRDWAAARAWLHNALAEE